MAEIGENSRGAEDQGSDDKGIGAGSEKQKERNESEDGRRKPGTGKRPG